MQETQRRGNGNRSERWGNAVESGVCVPNFSPVNFREVIEYDRGESKRTVPGPATATINEFYGEILITVFFFIIVGKVLPYDEGRGLV